MPKFRQTLRYRTGHIHGQTRIRMVDRRIEYECLHSFPQLTCAVISSPLEGGMNDF
jgi:hypothetical protein